MNETLKQFNEDLAKALKERLSSQQVSEFIEKTKSSGDDRTFEVVMSTSDEDRQGDALDQAGWDFSYFKLNPVVLFAHNYASFPVGVATDVQINGKETIATGKFAPAGVNPEADIVCSLYQAGILKAVSPGYIQNDDGTRELLEISFCPVPAGRYALSLRQVQQVGLSTRELVAKGFFTKANPPPVNKSPQIGDHCELDDGTPGVLAEDENNPGELVCVPSESGKSKTGETQEDMNNELIKKLKAEHGRHAESVAKAIDEFEAKFLGGKKSEEGADNTEAEKSIEEFKSALDSENDSHLEKCMKAIDENYELQDQKPKKSASAKSIDEFKSAMKSEHAEHVKCFDKAIDEFKAEDGEKAVEEFTKKAAAELTRHEKAHETLCEAEFGQGQDDDTKSDDGGESKPEAKPEEVPSEQKSGRAISAKNKEKIKAAIKALEDHHKAHGESTDNVIAALKDLMGPEGNEGEEPSGKAAEAPKPKVEVRDSRPSSEFEVFMDARRVLRTVDNAVGEALENLNNKFRKQFPARR